MKKKVLVIHLDEKLEEQVKWLLDLVNKDLGYKYYESRAHLIRVAVNHLAKKHREYREAEIA